VRQGLVAERTAYANRIRGLMGEFGFVIPQGIHHISERVHDLIEDARNEFSGLFRVTIVRLLEHFKELHRQVRELELQIQA
jgi:transposase